jgi:hypothetical protein
MAGVVATVTHRYFFDESDHTYFGYDVVIQPGKAANVYDVAFYDLSIGPLGFGLRQQDSLDPAVWKKLPMPPLPAAQPITLTDALALPVFADPATGGVMSDKLSFVRMPQLLQNAPMMLRTVMVQGSSVVQGSSAFAARNPAPVIDGPAREYSTEDAELHIQPARITINGTAEGHIGRVRAASGALVWIYVPGHGRYVLSLAPRTELGFAKAGEVRGDTVTFTAGKDQLRLDLTSAAAPGETAYVLYLLHDAEWAPTAQGQGGLVLCGSVSARELAALARK